MKNLLPQHITCYNNPMKSKKSLSSWKVAGIYCISFFVILFILELISQIIEQYLLFAFHISIDNRNFQIFLIQVIIFSYLTSILAIYMTAKLIKQYFVLKRVKQIIIWATLFNIILSAFLIARDIFFNPHLSGTTSIGSYAWTAISNILEILIFYLFSILFLQGSTFVPKLKMLFAKRLKP